jgi:hypothetical protein
MCDIPLAEVEVEVEDIGSALVAGHRRQVLLAAEQEAEDWVSSLPDGHPPPQGQGKTVVVLRGLREREREAAT